jgi:Ca-activated chloride channel family protein
MIHVDEKIYLLLLLIIPVLILWEKYTRKEGRRFIYFSSRKLFHGTGGSVKTWLAKNLNYFKIAALGLFIVALARPQILNYYYQEEGKGIDILLTLDISSSMLSFDFKPKNRLEVAKEVIANFVEKRKTDRIGLVIFAGTSYTKCPLTIDYDMLSYRLKETEIGELEDGTALGMALASSVNRIRYSKSKTKIVILLTDGVNNRGEIDPVDAARMAKDLNIKVYTIGVGTVGRAPFPVEDAFGKKQFVMMDVVIDEKLMQNIANSTGGLYFRATDRESLQKIFSEIDKWEKTEISEKRFARARELFVYFLLAGVLILLAAEFAKRTFLRILP